LASEFKTSEMKKLLTIISVALVVLGALILSERPAYGYTDPGTGLLAIQAAGSAIVAAGWYLRRKIYALFHRGQKSEERPQEFSAAKEDNGD
jgi:hypothetical protein